MDKDLDDVRVSRFKRISEMLKLENMKKCSGRNTHQGATRKLNSMTSRAEGVLCQKNACMHDVHSTCPLPPTPHNHKGWRSAPDAILPGHRRAPQWVPARTPTVHWGPVNGDGRGWPTTTAQRAKCRTHQTVQNTGLPTNMREQEQCQQQARTSAVPTAGEIPKRYQGELARIEQPTLEAKVVMDLVCRSCSRPRRTKIRPRSNEGEETTTMRSSAQQAVFVQIIQLRVKRQCQLTTRSRRW